MEKVRKAVIPAAGLGTRFLPATKSQAKEMIPIVDRPQIHYVVEEAVKAGIDDILIITSRGKSTLEDYFDRAPELEARLERTGKTEALEEVLHVASLANVHYVRQKEPAGFGDAVLAGKVHVGDHPFAVLVPDEIVPEPIGQETHLMKRMIEIYERDNASVIVVQEVPMEEISSYGSIDPEPVEKNVVRIKNMVEKPSPEDAPSNLAARGRYVFSPEIFTMIERTSPGVGGEIQLTDAINMLAHEQTVYAYIHDGPMFDVGNKLAFLRATVELALRREDLAKPFKEFLADISARLG